jgi:oligopeptidase A
MNESLTDNPLLDFRGLPRFDAIRAEHVTPAIALLLRRASATLDAVVEDARPVSWTTLAEPIAQALDGLERAWAAVSHLNAVVNTPELREAYNGNLPAITRFYAELGQNERLFERFRALRDAPEYATLDPARRRLIDNELRDFRLGGAELTADKKLRFKAVQEEKASVAARFDDNVLDATNAWALYVTDPAELAGIPADVVAEARAAAAGDGRAGWKLTLRMPCYLPVMLYADQRSLRAALHRGYVTRASALGADPAWDNAPLVARLLELRQEAARLLGFDNFGELSLARKMAGSPAEVLGFLHDLAARARPFALNDMAELSAFASEELGLAELAPWDIGWASEKLKAKRYAFSEQEVRQYFPEPKVLSGLFRLIETLYDVRIRPAEAATWHPSVRFFEITTPEGRRVGAFYLDSHARPGKQGGAWMDDAINRRRFGDQLQLPVAFLTCNLPAPAGAKPATFTHDDVITIFHEFGHGLHQLLTRIDVAGVSGIEGVEWDAVELPSQIMENWCWEWDVLTHMTAHVDTGAPLPKSLFERLLAAKNFHSGMETLRQIEFALFDMLLHSAYRPDGTGPWKSPDALAQAVRSEVAVVQRAEYDRSIDSFSHIFAGGYAAGYYSYKWAEVLSADAYARFEEEGVLSPVVGRSFFDEVLARGGSRPAMESFVAFRGRPPQIDALLRHNGMVGNV